MQEAFNPFELSGAESFWNRLRWAPSLEWAVEKKGNDSSVVTFLKGGSPSFKLEITNNLFEIVTRHLSSNEKKMASHFPIENNEVKEFIELLISRQIILTSPLCSAQVRIFTNIHTEITSWALESSLDLDIDILVGDEVALYSQYSEFLKSRSEKTLVCFVTLTADQIEVGPLRFVSEVEQPKTRASIPSHYPNWSHRLKTSLEILRELFEDAFSGSQQWYALTVRGFRKPWKWEEARAPYRVQVSPISIPKDCLPLFLFQARVENEEASGGAGETSAEAEYSAKCEAWERFCLARPDLATSSEILQAQDLRDAPGFYFDYLRSLTSSLSRGPKLSHGWTLSKNSKIRVPSEWIYFNEDMSAVNTNGAAFGATLEDAIESAKLEVIERHLLIKAYLKLTPGKEFVPHVQGTGNQGLGLTALALSKDKNRKVRWYHLGKCNKANAVICIVSSNSPPFVSLGSAARASMMDAARKSLFEALVTDFLWSHRIGQLGFKRFLKKGREIMNRPPNHIGLEESAWVWAAMSEAGSILHSIFDSGEPRTEDLNEDGFVAVDVGNNILSQGSVVKVIHPDAFPLPSFYGHALTLVEKLNIPAPLPIPMN